MVHNLFNTNAECHDRVGLLNIRNIQFSNVSLQAGYREVQYILNYQGKTTSFVPPLCVIHRSSHRPMVYNLVSRFALKKSLTKQMNVLQTSIFLSGANDREQDTV
jgi:hypothetical protein